MNCVHGIIYPAKAVIQHKQMVWLVGDVDPQWWFPDLNCKERNMSDDHSVDMSLGHTCIIADKSGPELLHGGRVDPFQAHRNAELNSSENSVSSVSWM